MKQIVVPASNTDRCYLLLSGSVINPDDPSLSLSVQTNGYWPYGCPLDLDGLRVLRDAIDQHIIECTTPQPSLIDKAMADVREKSIWDRP